MNLKQMREAYAKLMTEAKAIQGAAGTDGMTEEQAAQVTAKVNEAKALKAKIDAIENANAVADTIPAPAAQPQRTVGANVAISSGTRERAQDNPTRGYDGPGGFGRLASDVHALGTGSGMSEGLRILAAAGDGQTATISTEGGVLLPPAFSTTIQDRVQQASNSLLAMTDQQPNLPYGVDSMEFPIVDETSRADGSRQGGIQGRWKSELGQMSESKARLRSVKLSPNELYVYCFVSDKLLRNAPMLEAWLTARAADEINFKIGDSIINGTGSGQPRGILAGATDNPRVQISKETGQAAASVVTANLQKMYARMPAASINSAAWLINNDVLPALMDLTKVVGTGGLPIFLPGGNIASAPFGTILGRPIVPVEYCATLGTEGDVIFADLKQYGTMARGGIESAMSIHLKFDYNQTAFRFIFEIDGQPWHSSSLTPFKGTNKLSPFVTLATRS